MAEAPEQRQEKATLTPDRLRDNLEEVWPEWHVIAMAYCRGVDENLPAMLKESLNQDVPPTIAALGAAGRTATSKLWATLVLLCRDSALRLITTDCEMDNGFEAWHRLARRARGSGALRQKGLLVQILEYEFSGGDFSDRMHVWKEMISDYERSRAQALPDDIKMAALQAGATGELRKELIRRGPDFANFRQMEEFAQTYFDCLKSYPSKRQTPAKRSAQQQSTPMEVDAMHQKGKGKGNNKGNKGKGKGKGKDNSKGSQNSKDSGGKGGGTNINGYCGYCGIWGAPPERMQEGPGQRRVWQAAGQP